MTGAHVGQGAPLPSPRYKGFRVDLGGSGFTVPAMNVGTIEAYAERIQALQEGQDNLPMVLVADLLHRSLLRNYPELPRELVADHVDADNWPELFAMLMGESGFKQWAQINAEAGNARAQQILTENGWARLNGPGAPSLPTLSPAPAGPTSTAESS
jgi:hypothetical protein